MDLPYRDIPSFFSTFSIPQIASNQSQVVKHIHSILKHKFSLGTNCSITRKVCKTKFRNIPTKFPALNAFESDPIICIIYFTFAEIKFMLNSGQNTLTNMELTISGSPKSILILKSPNNCLKLLSSIIGDDVQEIFRLANCLLMENRWEIYCEIIFICI